MAVFVDLHEDVDEIVPGLVADRRHLHENPELGFQEHETAKFVAERLRSLGFDEVQTGVGKTGVVGILKGTAPGPGRGKVVALRADMDALPILEENEVDYRSQNDGVMHACGHDAHVTIQLGVARMLAKRRNEFGGTVKFIFQPAEEGLGGAVAMIKAGAFENPKPDAVFGIHVWQETPVGVVDARPGVAMVAADGFRITLTGKGGHGALPNLCHDPVAAGAQIVTALQTIVSRERRPTEPAVVTVATFHAGTASNVIPDVAELSGTIRTVSLDQREMIQRRIEEIATGIAAAMGVKAEVGYTFGVGATINDPAMTAIVRQAAADVVGPENSVEGPVKMVSEDMSEFLNLAPGCFYFVGTRNPEKGLVWGHHHARFDIDEAALAIGVETQTRTVLDYFRQAR
jgi:amidohydrolase